MTNTRAMSMTCLQKTWKRAWVVAAALVNSLGHTAGASPLIMLKHGILAQDSVPAAAKHRYYRFQTTSGGATVCGATKRKVDEVNLRWNGVYQTNAKTSSAGGDIGGLSVTVTDNGHYLTNEGWMAFGADNFFPPDGAFWGGGPNYDTTSNNYVTLDFGGNPVAITGWKITATTCAADGMRLYWSNDGTNYTLITQSEFYNVAIPYTDMEFTWTYADIMP